MACSLDSRVLDHAEEFEVLIFQEKLPNLYIKLMGDFDSESNMEEDLSIIPKSLNI